MKLFGIIGLAVIILSIILVLTIVMEVLELFVGAIIFFVAIGLLIYMYRKISNKIE